MVKFNLKCFHTDGENYMETFDMVPSSLLEFNRITYKCVECGREVFLDIEFPTSGGKD